MAKRTEIAQEAIKRWVAYCRGLNADDLGEDKLEDKHALNTYVELMLAFLCVATLLNLVVSIAALLIGK